jgi:hypothetical protein
MGLSHKPIRSANDALEALSEAIEMQREIVNNAPPEKKSLELKRYCNLLKLHHQVLLTARATTPPAKHDGLGPVSSILAAMLANSSKKCGRREKPPLHTSGETT